MANPPPSTCGGQMPTVLQSTETVVLTWDGDQHWRGCAINPVYGGNPNAGPSTYNVDVPVFFYLRFDGTNFWLKLGYPTVSNTSTFPLSGQNCNTQGWPSLSGFPNYGAGVQQAEWTQTSYQFNKGILYIRYDSPYCRSPVLTADPCWNYYIWYHGIYNVPCGTDLNRNQTLPPLELFSNEDSSGIVMPPPKNGIQVCGHSLGVFGLKFQPNGFGVVGPYFTAIRSGGTVDLGRSFLISGSGGPTLYSATVSGASLYRYNTSGGAALAGRPDVLVAHWSYTDSLHDIQPGTIDITLGGITPANPSYEYATQAMVTLSGRSDSLVNSDFPSQGGVTMSGSARSLGAVYHYTPTQGVHVAGSAGVYNSSKGLFQVSFSGDSTIVPLSTGQLVIIGYDETVTTDSLVPDNGVILTDCDCNALPGVLRLAHNVGAGGLLYQFLYRNSLNIESNLGMNYDANDANWRVNRHYQGLDPGSESSEAWHVLFDWGCASTIGGVDLGTSVWKFGLAARRIVGGLSRDTRLLMTFSSTGPCVQGVVDFQFHLNLSNQLITTNPGQVLNDVIFHDGIGMFGKPFYADNPILDFQISVQQTQSGITQLDSGVVFPPSQTFPEK